MVQISVIISTYNSVDWLKKVLWSYETQTFKNFEVIIADDGSAQETQDFIESYQKSSSYTVKHIWHPDDGFQKTVILNKAITASEADYLLFTDGDCIARQDFLQVHMNYREQGYFLSGGYFKLPMSISKLVSKSDVVTQNCFNINWLKSHGLKNSIKNLKLTATPSVASILNRFTPTVASWNGHNASGWKADIIKANGFDERMQYGGEDRELGERLFNSGIKSKQLRYSAVCVHLDHARGYVKPEMLEKNKAIRSTTKSEKLQRTLFGIEKS